MHKFGDGASITVNSASAIPQENQNGDEKDRQANPYEKNESNKIIEKNGIKTI